MQDQNKNNIILNWEKVLACLVLGRDLETYKVIFKVFESFNFTIKRADILLCEELKVN